MTNEAISVFNHIAGEVPLRLKGAGATMVKTEVGSRAALKLDKLIRVAGCQFDNEDGEAPESRQKFCKMLSAGSVVALVREPENAFDPNAIAVHFMSPRRTVRIGYIPGHLASVIAADMDNGFSPNGLVVDFREVKGNIHPVIHLFEYIS